MPTPKASPPSLHEKTTPKNERLLPWQHFQLIHHTAAAINTATATQEANKTHTQEKEQTANTHATKNGAP